jgi:periplasmic protein TonB
LKRCEWQRGQLENGKEPAARPSGARRRNAGARAIGSGQITEDIMEHYGFVILGAFAVATWVYAIVQHNYALLIGALVATGVHCAALYPGDWFGTGAPPEPPPCIATLILDPLPPLIPEEKPPEPVPPDGEAEEQVKLDFPPPQGPENLRPVTDRSFSMRPQVPPPPGLAPGGPMTKIPVDSRPRRAGADIVDITLVQQRPVPTFRIEPVYPYDLKREGIEGEVTLSFVVDTHGQARDIAVISSTHPGFEQAAIQALQKWRFRPGKKAGKTVNTGNVQQLIRFRLNRN